MRLLRHLTRQMNPEHTTAFFCPIEGCTHSSSIGNNPFPTKTTLLCHLNTLEHRPTHHLTNYASCATSGIFHCCSTSCPSSPTTFFTSLRALTIHTESSHPPPNPPVPTPNIPHHPPPLPNILHPSPTPPTLLPQRTPTTPPTTPHEIATQVIHRFSHPNILNHWVHGLSFISTIYDHEPPDFRTTWCHFLKGCNKASFLNLQASIL
jgi:hypothetical protein